MSLESIVIDAVGAKPGTSSGTATINHSNSIGDGVNAVWLDDTTFIIGDTRELCDVPEITIIDNGDGTWTAIANRDDLIVIEEDGEFVIRNANKEHINPYTYQITDTSIED